MTSQTRLPAYLISEGDIVLNKDGAEREVIEIDIAPTTDITFTYGDCSVETYAIADKLTVSE